ncbi:hypothetical protein BTVI_91813 [Pitangus sulphuratus]|nr:hypothetical protein BTVI_91813 [Pitangus sulphuratus]
MGGSQQARNWRVWNWLSNNYRLEKFSINYTLPGYETAERMKKNYTLNHGRGGKEKRIQAGNKMLVCSSTFDMLELRILRGGNKAQSKITTLDFSRGKSGFEYAWKNPTGNTPEEKRGPGELIDFQGSQSQNHPSQ